MESDLATGFLKYYAGQEYAFAALLPDAGISVEEVLATLTGEELQALLAEPKNTPVTAAIPKFEVEFDCELNEMLSDLGMPLAFDHAAADFSGLGSSTNGNVAISRVLHKTFIAVDEKGTKAGAATAVEMTEESAIEYPEPPKEVILNRPFVYLIVDCENRLPLFLGTVLTLE